MLALYQLNDANGLEIAQKVKESLETLKREAFPEDLEYGLQYDTTKFITSSIDEVKQTLFEAVFLVILVTFIFLQGLAFDAGSHDCDSGFPDRTFAVMLMIGYD